MNVVHMYQSVTWHMSFVPEHVHIVTTKDVPMTDAWCLLCFAIVRKVLSGFCSTQHDRSQALQHAHALLQFSPSIRHTIKDITQQASCRDGFGYWGLCVLVSVSSCARVSFRLDVHLKVESAPNEQPAQTIVILHTVIRLVSTKSAYFQPRERALFA